MDNFEPQKQWLLLIEKYWIFIKCIPSETLQELEKQSFLMTPADLFGKKYVLGFVK